MNTLVVRSSSRKKLLPLTLCLSLSACGDSGFTGSSKSEDGIGIPANPNSGYSLTWQWSCDSTESSMTENGRVIELVGPGPHSIEKSKASGAPVTFKGDHCAAESAARDVVFVIDLSGSMIGSGGTDPLSGGSCGRFKALEQVMAQVGATGNARFGVVTFSSSVRHATSTLYSSKDDVYTDLMGQASGAASKSIEKLICSGDGGTNYDAGLLKAEELLNGNKKSGRVREVYFISDGMPDPEASNGKVVAQRLHADTTVATVMVGGSSDTVLKSYIASRDALDEPLHARAENSDKLSDVLGKLSSNRIVSGQVTYGSKGSEGKEVDISDKIAGDTFDFEAFTINTDDAPSGLAVEFKYRDRFGGEQTSVGELIWKDAP